MLYSADVRADVSKRLTVVGKKPKQTDVAVEVAAAWKKLTASERAPYEEKAKELRAEHNIKLEAAGLPATGRSSKTMATMTEDELLDLIETLNADPNIHGILVQLPLPAHMNNAVVLDYIDPLKDVDGFHPYNVGCLAQRRPFLRSCTPYGIMTLLERYHLSVTGIDATVR